MSYSYIEMENEMKEEARLIEENELTYEEHLNATHGKKHPLLNDDSKHYSMFDGIEAIERMEQMFTIEDLMAWSKLSAMKYRLRIGNKDNVDKEAEKIKTYEAYYKYLQEKLESELA